MLPIDIFPQARKYPFASVTWCKAQRMSVAASRSHQFNRVFIASDEGLMGAGLQRLLGEEPSLVVRNCLLGNEASLITEIQRSLPDIVVLTSAEAVSPVRLLELLPDYGRLRIILVSLTDNTIEVYDRQRIRVENESAFLDQIIIQ